MFPILLELGPLTIHTYGVMIAAGFLAGMALASSLAKKSGRSPEVVQDMCFWAIVGAILGSRLLFVLMNFDYFLEHPAEIVMFWKGGLVFLGGAITAVLLIIRHLRKLNEPILPWADIMVPGLALGQFFGRLGCLAAGCCYGKACDLPWAITFTDPNSLAPLGVPLHPTQAYIALAALANMTVMVALFDRLKTPGRIAGIYLCIYAPARVFIETLRNDLPPDFGPFSTTQLIAMALFVLGVWLLLRPAPKPSAE